MYYIPCMDWIGPWICGIGGDDDDDDPFLCIDRCI